MHDTCVNAYGGDVLNCHRPIGCPDTVGAVLVTVRLVVPDTVGAVLVTARLVV